MGNHEARVEAPLVDQEGGQLAEGGVAQPLHPPLADGGQLVDGDGQEVQRLRAAARGLRRRIDVIAWRTGERTLAGYSPWKFPPEMVSPRSANTILEGD